MANAEHLKLLWEEVEEWNHWRDSTPGEIPDLSNADLCSATLIRANLSEANLNEADLSFAFLSSADLSHANLSHAILRDSLLFYTRLTDADLSSADLSYSDLCNANLSGANLSRANLSHADLSNANLSDADLTHANLINTTLNNANLDKTNLSKAILISTALKGANLSRACLRHTDLSNANLSGANLTHTDLSGADLSNTDLSNANLSGADLSGADLSNSNLHTAQVLGCFFIETNLTGACIEDWQIGRSTQLDGVKCEYIFRQLNREREFVQRLPTASNSIFSPGEFEKWATVRATALDTIDLTFTEGIDWQSLFSTLQQVRQQHPDSDIRMQAVEENGRAYVVRLRVETEVTGDDLEQLKAEIETQTKALYERQLIKAETRNEVLKETLDTALEQLAKASSNNIHGNVGSIGGSNYGSMNAHLGQAAAEITQLLSLLRHIVQAFPDKERKDTEYVLDDITRDLSGPDKIDPERIGHRFKQLNDVGATVAGLPDDVKQFTDNVTALWNKLEAVGIV